jgi:hypothetical protein
LVDPQVSRIKLDRQVELWRQHEELHRRRGLLLVRKDGLEVDLLLMATALPLPVPTVVASVRLRFDNYDLWPPSLLFTDPFTGEPLPPGAAPPALALDFRTDTPQGLIPGGHPETDRAFLCLPGVREYHHHPEHSSDHWLLHRGSGGAAGPGTLAGIAATLHRTIAATVIGLSVQTAAVFTPDGPQMQAAVGLVQGPRPAPAPVEPTADHTPFDGSPTDSEASSDAYPATNLPRRLVDRKVAQDPAGPIGAGSPS